jgi:hypothetical protein
LAAAARLADFEQVRPVIFGGLCTALSTALANLPTTKLEQCVADSGRSTGVATVMKH